VFLPFMNNTAETGGKLTFTDVPFGSEKASKEVSGNLNDKKNSVYSKKAALERRIEIIGVVLKEEEAKEVLKQKEEDVYTEVEIAEFLLDFGKVEYGAVKEHVFKIKNTGKHNLNIYSIKSDCGCLVNSYPKEPVKPGEEALISVSFDSKGRLGANKYNLQLQTNSGSGLIVLSVAADVFIKR
jgi:hypothetical protein